MERRQKDYNRNGWKINAKEINEGDRRLEIDLLKKENDTQRERSKQRIIK